MTYFRLFKMMVDYGRLTGILYIYVNFVNASAFCSLSKVHPEMAKMSSEKADGGHFSVCYGYGSSVAVVSVCFPVSQIVSPSFVHKMSLCT